MPKLLISQLLIALEYELGTKSKLSDSMNAQWSCMQYLILRFVNINEKTENLRNFIEFRDGVPIKCLIFQLLNAIEYFFLMIR